MPQAVRGSAALTGASRSSPPGSAESCYRQFDSKRDQYRAVLDRVCLQLATTVGTDQFSADSIPKLLRAASLDPDGIRLLFRYAAWEPDFREFTDALARRPPSAGGSPG